MEELIKYLSVFLAGAVGIWKGIPVGIALGISPFYTATLTSLGSIAAILLIYFSGEPFRKWIMSKYGDKSLARKKEKFSDWLDKYGIAGLGLLATGIIGPLITVLLGLVILNTPRKFIIYMIFGILFWTYSITYLSTPMAEFIKGIF